MDWGQPISQEIFIRKYMINGEQNPEEVFRGISQTISSVEKSKKKRAQYGEEFYDLINSGKFIPAGRILANARPNTLMPYFNNCYTIGIDDHIEDIYDSIKEDAQISRTGGGVGLNFSNLRPKGAKLSRGGESSGSVSFMKVFNESARIIQVGGARRSAHMGILNIDHPDIEEFITLKQGDTNSELTQFNISVGITDDFMEAVEKNKDWELKFKGKVYKTVKATYLYDLLAKNSFEHNEPGTFNIDNVHKEANSYYMYKILQTNPCFTGDTLVAVADGRNAVSIKELAEEGGNFPVYSARKKVSRNKTNGKWVSEIKNAIAFKTGVKHTIEVFLSDGTSFKCTPDHKLALASGDYIEARYSIGKTLEKFFSHSQGNGHRFINCKSDAHKKQYRMIFEYNNGSIENNEYVIHHEDHDKLNDDIDNLIMVSKKNHDIKEHDITGLCNPYWKVRSEKYFNLLQRRKNIQANASRYHWDAAKLESTLVIFEEENNFEEVKKEYFENSPKNFTCYNILKEEVSVVNIFEHAQEDVYDLTVDDNHNFYIINKSLDDRNVNTSGVLVHNCGEQSLPPYGVCDLGALNFVKFVDDAFLPTAKFNFRALGGSIKTAVRFLDNVLDATLYPLPKIKKRSIEERRIGLGFTGYADMLVMLGIKYGSEECKRFTENLAAFFRDTAYNASISLSKEKGRFKKFDKKILQSGFISRMSDDMKAKIKKYGLRNINILTIAPTGTTSLSLGQNCSSGIEPIFSLQYDRKIRTGNGDETKTETIYDFAYLEYLRHLEAKGETFVELPAAFTTTYDVNIYDAIDIQAIWQKYIDASISKTLNLAPGTSFKEYKNIFKYAYDAGLKGITSFNPEGSMAGILSTEPSIEEGDIPENHTQKRPKDLQCDIHSLSYKGEKYLCIVGVRYNRPWEIFVTPNPNGEIDVNKHKTGITRKVKKGQYSLILKNGEERVCIENIKESFDSIFGTLSRFISMGLRHHEPLQFIVEQLNKDDEFSGFARVVSRVLKKYIVEGEEVKTSVACPECGSVSLMYKEGCMTCECGWSKCS